MSMIQLITTVTGKETTTYHQKFQGQRGSWTLRDSELTQCLFGTENGPSGPRRRFGRLHLSQGFADLPAVATPQKGRCSCRFSGCVGWGLGMQD